MKKLHLSHALALLLALLCLTLPLTGCSGGTSEASGTSADGSGSDEASGPAVTAYADITVRDYGVITVALCGEDAPETVENFIALANDGFYDGLTFHRIIANFMIQGGDPNGDGTGGSGSTVHGEFSANGFKDNSLSHTRGTISMARSDYYNSASSQFFITQADCPHLDGMYAAFGYVTEGMDVVDAIVEGSDPLDSNGTIAAGQQPVIESVVIREANGDAQSSASDAA